MATRIESTIVELDLDKCANTYGTAPCTAAGAVKCYNTFRTCQDKANFVRTTQTIKFTGIGAPIPLGQALRPYVDAVTSAPTEIDVSKGLAARTATTVRLVDDTDSDRETDPYVATRAAKAGGTFWSRLLVRNHNLVGRPARVDRSFIDASGTRATGTVERFIIESIKGPDKNGEVTLSLKDPIKLADRAKAPTPSTGKLSVALAGVANAGTAQGGSSTTIILADSASAVDGAYVGFEVYISAAIGSGQRRTISAYVGATRTATVAAWLVVPTSTSSYQVSALSLTLGAGEGANYPSAGYVRVGKEVIRYDGKSTDTLQWSTAAYRGAWGTTAADAAVGDLVQLCLSYADQSVTDVLHDLLNRAGIVDANIDLTGMAAQDADYLSDFYRITALISDPVEISTLLRELCEQTMSVLWWSTIEQKVKFRVVLPPPPSATPAAPLTGDANLIEDSVAIERQDNERLTFTAVYFGLINATDDTSKPTSYRLGEAVIDTAAESVNEYGDRRTKVLTSRWFGAANAVAMRALAGRLLVRYRDPPRLVSFALDPKDDATKEGDILDLSHPQLIDESGARKTMRVLVTRRQRYGDRAELRAVEVYFDRRYGFIAPNGTADHPTDTIYAHVCQNSGLMTDGSAGYLTI